MPTQEEIKKAYLILQGVCGIGKEDMVKVIRKFDLEEMGNQSRYPKDAEIHIGDTGKVTTVCGRGWIHVLFDSTPKETHLPFFCLELVEKAPRVPSEVSFEKDGLTAGGVFVSTDTIRRNLNL